MSGASHRSHFLFAAAAALALSSAAARADMSAYPEQADARPSALAMAVDLAVGRPLGLAGSALGIVVFLVGLPFEAISGDVGGPGKRLVVEPLEFTFTRPLGEFN